MNKHCSRSFIKQAGQHAIQACQFIAEIFSKICGPVKHEICAENMRNMLRSHVRYKLA